MTAETASTPAPAREEMRDDPVELDERQLAGVLESLTVPVIVVSREGRVLHTNDGADDHFPVMEGDLWIDTLPAEERPGADLALSAARDNVARGFDVRRGDRIWTLTVQPTHVGLVICAQEKPAPSDDDERIVAERERMAEAMGEMEHRVANLMAMLPAIVKLSLRRARDVKAARAAVVGRISALSSAHSMMLKPEAVEEGVSLDAMIEAVLLSHGDERFVTTGPPVRLATRGSNTVALALHELAANAAQFGALSRPSGKVRIAWAIEASARDVKLPEGARSVLRILWSETGGPPIATPPTRRGFGTDVIDRLIASQGGSIEREWMLHGLGVTIDLPLYELGREPKFSGDLRQVRPVLPPESDEAAATQIVERAVAAVGGPGGTTHPGTKPSLLEPSGPSETEILGKLERIIRNTPTE